MQRKILILGTVFMLLISGSIFSQERKDGRKKIKVLKVSYITEELDLTEEEAVKFWPVYNKYEKKKTSLHFAERRKIKKLIENKGGIENLSEKDAKSITEKMLAIEKSSYQTQVDFLKEMSSIISYKKMVKLGMLEREFNRKLFNRYRKQKERKIKKGN